MGNEDLYELETYLTELAASNQKLKKISNQNQLQRRSEVVDLYGIEYTRQGDTNNPATFRFSVSQDLIYYERFEFKIIIDSFVMSIGDQGQTGGASLSIQNGLIVPDPHYHTVTTGVTVTESTVSNFRILIEDIDITPYLKAQFNGEWINGEGVFPTTGIVNYDILKAVAFMPTWQQAIILAAGYKKVQLVGDGAFRATLVNYTKYNHVNR